MRKKKILLVYGTRPEAIKMAPLVKALATSDSFDPVVAVTGQHREMLDQVNAAFGIAPDHDLDVFADRQGLGGITCKVLAGTEGLIRAEIPDAVLVQGDTTSCFAAALAAFYNKLPVIHLEAGLRTGAIYDPFPEEINRRLTGQLASLHLAPTATSRANLLAEGVADTAVHVTGNTVIDALLDMAARSPQRDHPLLQRLTARQIVLVTAHRRESWGAPMASAARGIARLAATYPQVQVVLPAHLNPVVREVLLPPLEGLANVLVVPPLDYPAFVAVMNRASIILTDSGGVQEEAPSLGKPVLVMRETSERPEAIAAGTVKLVGTNEDRVFAAASTLLTSERAYEAMAHAVNPYGDGHAAERCVAAIAHYFGLGQRPQDFQPVPVRQREPIFA